MKEQFVIVKRSLDQEVPEVWIANGIKSAMIMQAGLIMGVNWEEPGNTDIIWALIEKNTEEVIANLEKTRIDRLYNEEEEVYILWLPKQDRLK